MLKGRIILIKTENVLKETFIKISRGLNFPDRKIKTVPTEIIWEVGFFSFELTRCSIQEKKNMIH